MDQSDIHRICIDDKEIILIGTAHISRESAETVTRVIEETAPDTVCVELDEQRFKALQYRNQWESLNLKQVIRNGQVPFLMANLALSAFQKRMGLQTGTRPGAEMAAAAEAAEKLGLQVELVDRSIRTTLLRVWRKTGFWKKTQIMASLVASLFEKSEINEEELARLRQNDTLSAMLEEMSRMLPSVKSILVDERDLFMAHHIRNAPGKRIVAVLGAAHIPGIKPKPLLSKIIPWVIPSVVAALFIFGFLLGDRQQVTDAALAWVMANGLLSALGAFAALGHPLTILSAFIAAPITSLNPTIGAGFVTGLVQAIVASPTVRDMERLGEDLVAVRGWWENRLARVLLVFFFSSLGSTAGTFLAFHWLKDLI